MKIDIPFSEIAIVLALGGFLVVILHLVAKSKLKAKAEVDQQVKFETLKTQVEHLIKSVFILQDVCKVVPNANNLEVHLQGLPVNWQRLCRCISSITDQDMAYTMLKAWCKETKRWRLPQMERLTHEQRCQIYEFIKQYMPKGRDPDLLVHRYVDFGGKDEKREKYGISSNLMTKKKS